VLETQHAVKVEALQALLLEVCICVLILLYICPRATYYTSVLMLLYTCPHNTI
jgi:hypothetical protein